MSARLAAQPATAQLASVQHRSEQLDKILDHSSIHLDTAWHNLAQPSTALRRLTQHQLVAQQMSAEINTTPHSLTQLDHAVAQVSTAWWHSGAT